MALGLQCMVLRRISKTLIANSTSFLRVNCHSRKQKNEVVMRFLSSKPNTSTPVTRDANPPSLDKKNIFINIYKLPYIRHLAVMHKVKVQQTILTSVALPIASILSYYGYVPAGTGWCVGIIGFMICTFFYSLSFFGKNFIGFIYISSDNSTVRISYVDGWGRRVDEDFPADDLVPLSELPRSFYEPLFYKLQRYSKQQKGGLYKLNISEAAQITDQDRFSNLFGKIEL